MTINNIKPTRHTTTISINIKYWKKFNTVFWSEKIYKFYIVQKLVSGDNVLFEVRSMRINEFCDILDKNNIEWKLPDEKNRL